MNSICLKSVKSVKMDKLRDVSHRDDNCYNVKGNYVAVGCHYSGQINSLASPTCKKTCKTPC